MWGLLLELLSELVEGNAALLGECNFLFLGRLLSVSDSIFDLDKGSNYDLGEDVTLIELDKSEGSVKGLVHFLREVLKIGEESTEIVDLKMILEIGKHYIEGLTFLVLAALDNALLFLTL